MNNQTILQLNQLNQDFYKNVATSFNQTRQFYWLGWNALLPELHQIYAICQKEGRAMTVCDVACGNGRFGKFLLEKGMNHIQYHGIDTSEILLEEAKLIECDSSFERIDIVETMSANMKLIAKKCDVIVALGILHHIPSLELRQKFYSELQNNCKSLQVVAAWQFLPNEELDVKMKKEISDLEEEDHFLGWKNTNQIRYCHKVSQQELSEAFPSSKFFCSDKGRSWNVYAALYSG